MKKKEKSFYFPRGWKKMKKLSFFFFNFDISLLFPPPSSFLVIPKGICKLMLINLVMSILKWADSKKRLIYLFINTKDWNQKNKKRWYSEGPVKGNRAEWWMWVNWISIDKNKREKGFFTVIILIKTKKSIGKSQRLISKDWFYFFKLKSHSLMRIFAFECVRFPLSFSLFMSFSSLSFFLSFWIDLYFFLILSVYFSSRLFWEANTWWVSFPLLCASHQ